MDYSFCVGKEALNAAKRRKVVKVAIPVSGWTSSLAIFRAFGGRTCWVEMIGYDVLKSARIFFPEALRWLLTIYRDGRWAHSDWILYNVVYIMWAKCIGCCAQVAHNASSCRDGPSSYTKIGSMKRTLGTPATARPQNAGS